MFPYHGLETTVDEILILWVFRGRLLGTLSVVDQYLKRTMEDPDLRQQKLDNQVKAAQSVTICRPKLTQTH